MRSLRLAALVTVMTAAADVAMAQTVLDRIVAIVNGTIVTQSDVRQAMDLKLVTAAAAVGADRAATERAIVDALVNRILILAEVERYAPPDPPAEAITTARRQWATTIGAGVDIPALLARAGLTEAGLAAWLRDDLRIQAYEDRRFAATSILMREDLLKYYNEHAAEFRTPQGGLKLFDEVQADVRATLTARAREAAVRDWIAGLRQRADIR